MKSIDDCISFLSGKAAQAIFREARDALAPFGITPVQYAALQVLWESDGRTGAEIGARLVLDSATITGVLDRLEKLEMIERFPDDSDRRINRIHLTRKGKARRIPLQKAMNELNTRVNAHFGSESGPMRRMLRDLASYQRR